MLETSLRRWRRQFARWLWLEHGSRVLAASVAAVVGALALDALVALPIEVRWGLWACGLGAFAWALQRRLVSPWRGLRAQDLLRRAEERAPELGAFLVSAWELRGRVPSGTSSALAAEHRACAERLLARTQVPDLYPTGLSSGARRALVGAAGWSLLAGAWLWRASPGVDRVLAPWLELPLDELITVAPGSARLPWESPVELSAEWRDHRHERLELWLRTGAGTLAEVPWETEDRGRFAFRLAQLNGPAEYQLRWRGNRSRRYRLEAVPRPQLAGARLRVYPPGRATGSFQEIPLEGAGEVAALRGSWIVASGKPVVPLSKAALRVSFLDASVEMRRVDASWEGSFPLREDGRLQFELTSEEGMTDPAPVSYSLRALNDEPPRVDLLSPTFETEASPRDRLEVSYHADDDYGLTALSLVYRVPGPSGPLERSVPLARPGPGKESYGEYAWDLSDLPVGSRVEFQVKAEDNASPRPQAGWSQKGTVRVADLDKIHADAELHMLNLEAALEQLAQKEGELRSLAGDAAKSPQAAQAERERLAGLQKQLAADWKQAAGLAQEYSKAMTQDAYSNPGVAAEAQALASMMEEAASRDFPKAAAAVERGEFGEGEKRHGQLEARARMASQRLSQARQMQGLQDFWNDADRLDQEGGELSKALSEMAGGRKPSAEDKQRLQKALEKLQKSMEELAKAIDSLPKAAENSAQDKSRKTYQVPLNQAMQAADALQRALAAGDYAAAARIAQQLSDQLSRVRQAVGDAAREQASGMGGEGEDKLSEKLNAAGAAWDEVIQEQTRSLVQAQKLEERKTQELLDAQSRLLDQLREKQAEAVRRGRALGARMPPDAMTWMIQALHEFERKALAEAPDALRHAVSRLQAQAAADPAQAPEFIDLSSREREILDLLAAGAKPPPPTAERLSESQAAAATQGQVRGKTESLQKQIDELSVEAGGLPQSVTEPLGAAIQEQSGAQQALGSADSTAAAGHEQSALEHLEKGRQALQDAAQSQAQSEAGMSKPFGQPRGGVRRASGGRTGADTGFVPLPSSKDYQPPRELRKELERSSNERRPSAYDPVIKEYLRRMSE